MGSTPFPAACSGEGITISARVRSQLIQALELVLPQHAHCGIASDQPASRSTAASSASPTTSTPSASG